MLGVVARSSFSINSTSPHFQLGSPQGLLNEYYDSVERSRRHEGSLDRCDARGSRPSSGAGIRSGSFRSSEKPRSAAGSLVKKKSAAKPKAKNAELERRERIRAMQKLYGLARDEDEESRTPSTGTPGSSDADLPAPGPLRLAEGRLPGQPQVTLAVDSALQALQASITACEQAPVHDDRLQRAAVVTGSPGEAWQATSWPLPSLPEDPLNTSTLSLNSSGGLIAWSKGLQREEDNSPPATLASFFKA